MNYIQRVEERFYKELDVNYSFIEEKESDSSDKYFSKTVNINRFGLCLPLKNPVKPNSIIQVSLQLPQHKDGMVMLGKIIWCKQVSKDEYMAGIRFMGVLPCRVDDIVEIK